MLFCVSRLFRASGRATFVLLLAALMPVHAMAAAFGMVADNSGDRVSIFDALTDLVTANVAAVPGAVGDCVVSGDERQGFTTNGGQDISFIDLQGGNADALPRSSAHISNLGVDMSLSPDNAWLVTAGGGAIYQPLSVIDTRTHREVSTTELFADHSSVEFCDDGTLLVTTTFGEQYGPNPDDALYDARLADDLGIKRLGHRVSSGAQPNNSACAPGSGAGVLLDRNGGLTSFTLPGLQPADFQRLQGASGISAVFSDDGKRVFVRTTDTVEAFDFDIRSGVMRRAWTRPVAESSSYFGMDQIAVNPQNGRLYVDGGRELLIMDPGSGATLGEISAGDATGVCFARAVRGTPTDPLARALTMETAPP